MRTLDLECNHPSELAELVEQARAGEETAGVESLRVALRWWQPFAPLAALIRERRWPSLHSFALSIPARLPEAELSSILFPRDAPLSTLDLATAVGDACLARMTEHPAFPGLRGLWLWDADIGAAGVEALTRAPVPLEELLVSGRSLAVAEAEALLAGRWKPGARITLTVHGPPAARGSLRDRAAGSAVALNLDERDQPHPLSLSSPLEWVRVPQAAGTHLDLELADPWVVRMFVDSEYRHPALSMHLRLPDVGVLAEKAWAHHFPDLRALEVRRADGAALSVWDLVAISYWQLPHGLQRLVLHPHEWGWYQDYPTAHAAALRIIDRLDHPPPSVLELSDLPEAVNPGSVERARRELFRRHCSVSWR